MAKQVEITDSELVRRCEGERARLVMEMQEDARWQLQLFTFAVTVTGVILGLVSKLEGTSTGLPAVIVFLSPLVILVPSSLMILNRARTRNRKAAFIFVSIDHKLLCLAGVEEGDSIDTVARRDDLPWETALHILERRNRSSLRKSSKRPHLGPDLRNMAACFLGIELLCVGLAASVAASNSPEATHAVQAVIGAETALFALRGALLWRLTRGTSIQGYASKWLRQRYLHDEIPFQYLSQFVAEYEKPLWYQRLLSRSVSKHPGTAA